MTEKGFAVPGPADDRPGAAPPIRRPSTYSNRLKRHRAVATRYEKLAVRYEATVLVAAINEWL
ncbi:hypothetical protein [Streptomyces sp. NBC_00829]|uniref:hypothetical protein n=1 Tax=Streptomyces sp. NBC_00829 TaxID=2903679 RepID=UPI00386AF21F